MKISHNMRRVLVLDGDLVPALAVARSLGRIGIQVDLASYAPHPLARWSRYVKQTLFYPDPMLEEQAFVDWLKHVAKAEDYALIIPVSERTVVPFCRHRAAIAELPLALPGNSSLETALDKPGTFSLATELGIPVPRSATLSTLDQLPEAILGLSYPIVVKPARSLGRGEQGAVQLSVAYAIDATQLRSHVTHALRYGEVVLQEFFIGSGIGIELIADQGKVVYAFQHQRLHEVPLTGGGSSLRESVAIQPELLEATQKLMTALGWHGIAMVEFKWNSETGEFRLMEINGRFWGSLPLAIAAGADFPAMLYELQVDGHIRPRSPARLGVVCRKLSADLYWHELVLRKTRLPAGMPPAPGWRELLHSLRLFLRPHHRFDVQSLTDPLPGFVDICHIVRHYMTRLHDILRNQKLLHQQRNHWGNGRVVHRLLTARRVLFVCHGNINRSALAERYWKYLTETRLLSGLTPESAGFHATASRPADPVMVEIARKNGVNLGNWSSRTLSSDQVDQSDLIFVMELQHLKRMHAEYPNAADKVYLLGLADETATPGGEIADPYGLSPEHYTQCFHQVVGCVNQLASLHQHSKCSSAQKI